MGVWRKNTLRCVRRANYLGRAAALQQLRIEHAKIRHCKKARPSDNESVCVQRAAKTPGFARWARVERIKQRRHVSGRDEVSDNWLGTRAAISAAAKRAAVGQFSLRNTQALRPAPAPIVAECRYKIALIARCAGAQIKFTGQRVLHERHQRGCTTAARLSEIAIAFAASLSQGLLRDERVGAHRGLTDVVGEIQVGLWREIVKIRPRLRE